MRRLELDHQAQTFAFLHTSASLNHTSLGMVGQTAVRHLTDPRHERALHFIHKQVIFKRDFTGRLLKIINRVLSEGDESILFLSPTQP